MDGRPFIAHLSLADGGREGLPRLASSLIGGYDIGHVDGSAVSFRAWGLDCGGATPGPARRIDGGRPEQL